MEMEKKGPSFHKMCERPCCYSGNRQLRNLQALNRLFTDVQGPCLHEGTSKHEGLFLILKVIYVFVFTILCAHCAGVNICPMGQTFIKYKVAYKLFKVETDCIQRKSLNLDTFKIGQFQN